MFVLWLFIPSFTIGLPSIQLPDIRGLLTNLLMLFTMIGLTLVMLMKTAEGIAEDSRY